MALVRDGLSGTLTLLQNVSGTLVVRSELAGAAFPSVDIVAADFDNDGYIDLATANSSASSAYVYLNHGAWSFAPPVSIPLFGSVVAIEAGDLDGDGDIDLAFARTSATNGALVALNDGAGGFANVVPIDAGNDDDVLALGDADNDGDLDVFLGLINTPNMRVVLNQGAGVFAPPTLLAIAARRIIPVDVDADGDLDLGVVTGGGLVIARNSGGAFVMDPVIDCGVGPGLGASADLDQDGDSDFVVQSVSGLTIVRNDGAPAWHTHTFVPAYAINARFGALNDVDRDGDVDLTLLSTVVQSVLNEGSGDFAEAGTYPLALSPNGLAIGDLDGDGALDVACTSISNYPPYTSTTLLRNGGVGSLERVAELNSSFAERIHLADVDGDLDLDILRNASAAGVSVSLNLGGFVFSPPVSYPVGVAVLDSCVVDLDGDGDLDSVSLRGNVGNPGVLWIANLGAGTFGPATFIPTGTNPSAIAARDFDGDGDVDLVFSDAGDTRLTFLRNDGSGSLHPFLSASTGATSTGIGVADFDGDGDDDIALAQASAGQVLVLDNLGAFAFAARPPIAWGGSPQALSVADLDADGDEDLIVTPSTSALPLALLVNDSTGHLSFAAEMTTGFRPRAVAAADLDGDGDDEVLFTRYQTQSLCVRKGCTIAGNVVCAGDGSGTPCPCGNISPLGLGRGCLNSTGAGASLRASGSARIGDDRLVLTGTSMPNALAVFFQGTQLLNSGAGVVFGDGLACVGGNVVRLGSSTNVAGGSHVPGVGAAALHVRGNVTAPGERFYSVLYRNAASFCTPSTFNQTNALRIVWAY